MYNIILLPFIASLLYICLPYFINKYFIFKVNKNTPKYYAHSDFFVNGMNCIFQDNGDHTPIVILSHGNNENIYNKSSWFYNLTDVSLFVYDYRGYGKSVEKNPTTKSILRDGENIINYVMNNYPDRKIILVGNNIGCSVAWYLASKYNISGLVIISGFTSLKNVINDHVWFLGTILSWFMFFPNNKKYIDDVKCPILLIHGNNDKMVDKSHMFEIYESCKTAQYKIVYGNHDLKIYNFCNFLLNFIKNNEI